MNSTPSSNEQPSQWSRFKSASVVAYHRYGNWLVGISWRKFLGLSLLLIVAMGILHDIPPLSWTYTEVIPAKDPGKLKSLSRESSESTKIKGGMVYPSGKDGVDISIDENGVRIKARSAPVVPVAPPVASVPAAPPEMRAATRV